MGEWSIAAAGTAGQGVQTIGEVITVAARKQGYAVFSWKEYESRIRGGQNSYRIRVSEDPKNAPVERMDIVLALNMEAAEKYGFLVKQDGLLLAPESSNKNALAMDFQALANESAGKKIFANAAAAGALAAAMGMNPQGVKSELAARFTEKGAESVAGNESAFQAGYDHAMALCKDRRTPSIPDRDQRPEALTNVHEAIAIGAAYAGCRAIFAYPMTPSTNIIGQMAARWEDLGVFWEQVEDEIAAINMAIGASYAGARAMTATSGGGFSLMAEGISLAGMTETPLVIVLAQRPGPATGLPTRTAQGDLQFALNAGHGEFPKIVLAPSDPKEAFHLTVKAFNMADKYQAPVIILTDQHLSDAHFTQDIHPEESEPEYHLARDCENPPYRRYAITREGISPRMYPGQSEHLVCADSDEHDESGHITEDLFNTAPAMAEKRLRKIKAMEREIPEAFTHVPSKSEIILMGWGSSGNALFEAAELLTQEGRRTGVIHFTHLWPFPELPPLQGEKLFSVENCALPQLARLVRQETGLSFTGSVLRYDGLPLTGTYIRDLILESL